MGKCICTVGPALLHGGISSFPPSSEHTIPIFVLLHRLIAECTPQGMFNLTGRACGSTQDCQYALASQHNRRHSLHSLA